MAALIAGTAAAKEAPQATAKTAAKTAADSPAFAAYRQEVDRLSEQEYRRFRKLLDPKGLLDKRPAYELAHKTPVKTCFDRKWSTTQCADLGNLKVVAAAKPVAKPPAKQAAR